ncbi:MAG: ABC transporter permease subunit [Oscillospiraceae bacterium]|nr:ABC transporter permease subunit [Oscillospiraceae bacterium]
MSKAAKAPMGLTARRKLFVKQFIQYKSLLVMLLIPFVYIVIFAYIPMSGLVLAFKDFKYAGGIWGSPWVGLANFRFFFISGAARTVIPMTVMYNLAFIVVGMFVQVSFAIILNEVIGKVYKRLAQSMMLLPHFISWVVASALVYNILNYEFGVFNNLRADIGLDPVNVYGNPGYWPFIMVFLSIWKGAGYGTIIYLANITSIDTEIFEAAQIDGANAWQQITRITIPHLKSTMIIMLLLAMGNMFRGGLDMFYQIIGNNGILLPRADVIDTYVFRLLMSSSDIGMAAAAGLFQSVLGFLTVLTANYVVKKIEPDYALF